MMKQREGMKRKGKKRNRYEGRRRKVYRRSDQMMNGIIRKLK